MFARRFRQAQAERRSACLQCCDAPVGRLFKGKIILGKYLGETLNRAPHGLGVAMYADDCVYIGELWER